MHVSLLGTGLLGCAVAERLLTAGYSLNVWNRSPHKSEVLAEKGALHRPTAAEALQASRFILLFLADYAAIDAALFNTNTTPFLSGRVIVNMATISPDESKSLASRLHHFGAEYAECPVLGSLPEAGNGTLLLMFGGTQAQFARLLPLLNALGEEPRHIGTVGQAAALKLALNQLIASETAAFAMSLALIQAHDVAVDDFMHILRGSALYAPTFDKKLDRMLQGDFTHPNFPLHHLIKDTRLFIASAAAQGMNVSVLQALLTRLQQVADDGHGDEDYSALQLGFSAPRHDSPSDESVIGSPS